MAKIVNGILGGISGKVAGVVGGSWKGINYVRAYTVPSNPNTTAQQAQRTKFSAVRQLASSVLASVLQPYWDPFQSEMSGYNKFMSANLSAWSDADDIASAVMAQGTLEGDTIITALYNDSTGNCTLDLTNNPMGNGAGTDSAVWVIYDAANNIAFVSDGTYYRNEGEILLSIGAGRTASDLHAFVFFRRGTGDSLTVSNSDYSVVTAE